MEQCKGGEEIFLTYPLPVEAVDDIHQVEVLVQYGVLVDQLHVVILRVDAELGADELSQVTNPNAGRTLQILDLWDVFGTNLR